jgi:hypothetical protein
MEEVEIAEKHEIALDRGPSSSVRVRHGSLRRRELLVSQPLIQLGKARRSARER